VELLFCNFFFFGDLNASSDYLWIFYKIAKMSVPWLVFDLVLDHMDNDKTSKFSDMLNWIEANNDWRRGWSEVPL